MLMPVCIIRPWPPGEQEPEVALAVIVEISVLRAVGMKHKLANSVLARVKEDVDAQIGIIEKVVRRARRLVRVDPQLVDALV